MDARWGAKVGAALALGIALRLWFIWVYAQVSPDALLYGDIAQNLLKHGAYGRSAVVNGLAVVHPTLIRLPGYPLFLAAVFAIFGAGKYGAVMGVQVALDLWTCLLAAGTARRIFGGDRSFLVTLWIGCLCPFMANYTALPLTEVATLFTIALAFYGLVRWQETRADRWVWVIGFATAWSLLLRPEQGMLAAVVVPCMVWIGRDTKQNALISGSDHLSGRWTLRVGLVCLMTLLPLVPWAARNWRTFHVVQPLAPRYAIDPGEKNPYGFQRWFRSFAIDFASTDQIYWVYDGDQIAVADLPNRAFDSNQEYSDTEALFADYNKTTTASDAFDGRFAAIAAERVKADPVRYYVALPLARLLNMILRPRADLLPWPLEWWKWREDPLVSAEVAGYAVLNLAYLSVAWMGFERRGLWRGQRVVVWGMVATIVLRCLLLLTVDDSEPRYTLEFYPVLLVLGGGWLASLHFRKRARA